MSYNGSGVWSANSAGLPVVTGTVISSTMMNALTADLATGLTTALCKDGQSTTTALVNFALGASSPDNVFYLKDNGDATKIAQFQCSGITTATTRTYTFPDANMTFARIDAGQTFTGVQTMTSPAITTPAFTGTFSGTYTLGGTPTIGAATWSGTQSGGGNNLNNVIIGSVTPLAGAFTTLGATGASTLTGKITSSQSLNGDYQMEVINSHATNGYGFRVRGGNASTNITFAAQTYNGGVDLFRVLGNGALLVGNPTGGEQGAGSCNFDADIYKDGNAYTNPDFVLEKWATGQIVKFADKEGARDYLGLMALTETEAFARTNLHLPRFGQKAGHGFFSGSEALLASVEEAYLHLFAHESRIAALERK